MSSRKIDVELSLKDGLTSGLKNSISAMTSLSNAGVKAGKQIASFGKQISAVGTKLTAAITVPLAGLAATSVTSFGEVDKQLRLVQSTMGEKWDDSLTDALKTAAADSVYTMSEASEACLNFARQGFSAVEVADMLTPALNLAAGNSLDLSTTTEGLGVAMKVFGADASEAEKYADMFAQAASQANTTVTDLMDGVSNAGTMTAAVGWSLSDLTAMLDVMGDAGIGASEAANGISAGLKRMAGNSTALKALDSLGIEIFDDTGTMKDMLSVIDELKQGLAGMSDEDTLAALRNIFGQAQADKWLTLINDSNGSLAEYKNNIESVSGLSSEMADSLMGGVGGSIESLKSSFDVLKYTIGDLLAGYVQPFIDKITSLIDAFNNMDQEQQEQIAHWAAIAAAVGPCLLVIGKLVTSFGNAVVWFNKVGKAVKAAKTVMAAFSGPILIVVAAIAAIIAIVAVVVTHIDQFKAAVQSAYENIAPSIENLMASFSGFGSAVSPILSMIGDLIANILCGAIEGFGQTVSIVIDGVALVITGIGETIQGVVDLVTAIINGDWSTAWEAAKNIVSGVVDTITGILETLAGVISTVVGTVSGALSGIGSFVSSIGSKITGNASGTTSWRGGVTRVNERGGEIIDLPQGTRIYPHDQSLAMAAAAGAQNSASVNISGCQFTVREDADIDKIASSIVDKLRKAQSNQGGWSYSANMA